MSRFFPTAVLVWIGLLMWVPLGCSSGNSPVAPANPDESPAMETTPELSGATTAPGHHLLGAFSLEFDLDAATVTPIPNRAAMAHYNVTPFLLPPHCYDCFGIEIEEFWPDQHRMYVYVTLKNPFVVTGYSIRAILMHNQPGWDLEWADGYTSLFDDGGGVAINPFRALYDIEAGHGTALPMRIIFPDNPDFGNVNFVVEASWPEHCEDVYILKHYGEVIPVNYSGSNIHIDVNASDYQQDVVSVTLDATEIGAGIVDFEKDDIYSFYWSADFFSPGASGGVEPGEYRLLITALSNSPIATYTYVEFFINPLPSPIDVTPGGLEFGTHKIVVWDEYRLVSSRLHYGIDIFDASHQEKPFWTGYVQLQDNDIDHSYLRDIEIIGNRAFVAETGVGVHVVDIECIYAPELITTIETDYPVDLAYGEGYLYVLATSEESGEPANIMIIDPNATPFPDVEGQFEVAKLPSCIGVKDGRLFCIADDRLFAFDLADPLNPGLIGEIQIVPEFYTYCPELVISGDTLYFITTDGGYSRITAVDIADPANMEIIGSVYTSPVNRNFSLKDGYAYITYSAHNSDGITIVDIDPPEDMHIAGEITTVGAPNDITTGAKYIYTTELDPGGICVYDSEPPESPGYLNKVEKIEKPDKLILDGDYAYLVDKYSSFKVLDINPPERTRIINSLKIVGDEGLIVDMVIDGDIACLMKWCPFQGQKKLIVISIEDPENPVIMSVVSGIAWGGSQRVVTGNGYAIVGQTYDLAIIDIDPPEESHIAMTIPSPYKTQPMAFKNDRLYLYSGEGLRVYDAQNPMNLQLLGEMPYLGDLKSFTVRGNYAYAGGDGAIMVIKVSDPQNMEVVANEYVPFTPFEIFVMSGFLFSAAGTQGVWIADIFPPGTIEPVFDLELPAVFGGANDVECQGGYMFVTTAGMDVDSLRIYKWW